MQITTAFLATGFASLGLAHGKIQQAQNATLDSRAGVDMLIHVINKTPDQISLQLRSNAGAPEIYVFAGKLNFAPKHTTTLIGPLNWSGNIWAGDSVATSKIEASNRDPASQDKSSFDVSYVDGYSHPITCKRLDNHVYFAGCNKDLFAMGSCPLPEYGTGFCKNPTRGVADWGPPHPFFAPCAKAAYTFVKDDVGTKDAGMVKEIECCIGAACPPSVAQIGHGATYAKATDIRPVSANSKAVSLQLNTVPADSIPSNTTVVSSIQSQHAASSSTSQVSSISTDRLMTTARSINTTVMRPTGIPLSGVSFPTAHWTAKPMNSRAPFYSAPLFMLGPVAVIFGMIL